MNKTIEAQLNHKTIRKFKDTPLNPEIIHTLVDVAQHTSTSSFLQGMSIISVTDQKKKDAIASIGKQPYIGENGHLFIFILDNYRNTQIALEDDVTSDMGSTTTKFLSSFSDCLLACQNVLVAAESMGLGGVILGSILNDAKELIDVLKLPKLTFPIIGLVVGYPDQEPQLKPRMPQNMIHFENEYVSFDNYHEALKDYDEIVTDYYDLRDANTRIDSFTLQATKSQQSIYEGCLKLKKTLEEQGLMVK